MRRDVIISVFLFFVFFALVFVYLFPIYFAYGQVFFRSVSIAERIMSVFFVLCWVALCGYCAYFKKLTAFFGGLLYALLPYIPEMVIPRLSTATPGSEPNLFTSLLDSLLRRIYELVHAPMVGISVLFPPEKAIGIGKLMLPVLVFSYLATQIFRFYRNAYLADQLLLSDAPQRAAYPRRAADMQEESVSKKESSSISALTKLKRKATAFFAKPVPAPTRKSAGETSTGPEVQAEKSEDRSGQATEKPDVEPGSSEADKKDAGSEQTDISGDFPESGESRASAGENDEIPL
ncbi:MAG: hypothetical protein JW780_03445 [Clostridiales bacterium]|nr:hypothetical protein [Clostridiales bacterium]